MSFWNHQHLACVNPGGIRKPVRIRLVNLSPSASVSVDLRRDLPQAVARLHCVGAARRGTARSVALACCRTILAFRRIGQPDVLSLYKSDTTHPVNEVSDFQKFYYIFRSASTCAGFCAAPVHLLCHSFPESAPSSPAPTKKQETFS